MLVLQLNDKQFDVNCSSTGRAYHFTVLEAGTTQMWSDLIAAMVERQKELVLNGLYNSNTNDMTDRNSD